MDLDSFAFDVGCVHMQQKVLNSGYGVGRLAGTGKDDGGSRHGSMRHKDGMTKPGPEMALSFSVERERGSKLQGAR